MGDCPLLAQSGHATTEFQCPVAVYERATGITNERQMNQPRRSKPTSQGVAIILVCSWVANLGDYHAQIGFDWRDRCRRRGPFGVPNFSQVVCRQESVRVSRTRRPQKLEDLARQEASLVSHGEPTDER